jgi:hypothetical protein
VRVRVRVRVRLCLRVRVRVRVCVCVCVCVCPGTNICANSFIFLSTIFFFLDKHFRRTEFATRLQATNLLPALDAGEVTIFFFYPSIFAFFPPRIFFSRFSFFFRRKDGPHAN